MYRTALPTIRALALRPTTITPLLIRPRGQQLLRQTPASLKWRGYAAAAGLSKEDISSRVMDVMKTFEKVDGGKVGASPYTFSALRPVIELFPRVFHPRKRFYSDSSGQ